MVLLIGWHNSGRLLLYFRQDIPSRFLKEKFDCNIKSICVERNLRKMKLFINGWYIPDKSFLSNHPECLNCTIDEYNKIFQFFLFLEEFNVFINESCSAEFGNLHGLTRLIKKPARFKNHNKSACIDLIITNQPNCFRYRKNFLNFTYWQSVSLK